jgi:hypothetical protein
MKKNKCLLCGARFVPKRHALGKYCSSRCSWRRPRYGKENPNWRGGRIKMHDGRVAVYAPGHPGANLMGGSHILEYRLLAEKIVGRRLRPNEIVHHKNGDPTDNRLENLEVTTQAQHAAIHCEERRDKKTGRFI